MMVTVSNDMYCCAVNELNHIAEYDDPKELLLDVVQGGSYQDNGYGDPEFIDPGAFIVFTDVIKSGRQRLGYNMGTKFAAYITEHALGPITESVGRRNRINHPDHTVKVWVWAPSVPKLRKWYRANKAKIEKSEEKDY